MIPIENVFVVHSTDLSSPDLLFEMVMEYCDKTEKDKWQEFGFAFASNKHTVVVLEKEGDEFYPIGYCNGEVGLDGKLFLNHGYMRKPTNKPVVLMDAIYNKFTEHFKVLPSQMVIHSDLPSRMWRRWGFKESNIKIYEREMGGQNG